MNESEQDKQTSISVITATYNAVEYLPRLIESLRKQKDKDFEWVVADGGSDDGTLELLQSITDLNIVISSQPDFGIYDALNRAINKSSGKYYIVSGADDYFYSDAIASYRHAINQSNADIIAAHAMYGKNLRKTKKGPSWIFGQFAYIASHTLATAFRKDLHRMYGYYSRKYPIAADQFFVIKACEGGARRYGSNFIAGEIGREGVSSVDKAGGATEVFRVQITTGRSVVVQLFLLMLRLTR